MGWIVAIIVGGIAGWLASMVMARDASMGIFWNIVVGIIGAIIGNAVIAPLVGIGGSIQTFNLGGFIIAIIGAIVLLAIVNGSPRGPITCAGRIFWFSIIRSSGRRSRRR